MTGPDGRRTRRGKVELATARTLRGIEETCPAHDALSAVAVVLAKALDEGAGLATAAVARELRATLAVLTSAGGGDDDGCEAIVAGLSAPVVDSA